MVVLIIPEHQRSLLNKALVAAHAKIGMLTVLLTVALYVP